MSDLSQPSDANAPRGKPLRSWRWLLPGALLPLLAVLILEALGGKDAIQVLTGIQPLSDLEILLGGCYLLAWTALTLVSPVFVGAAVLIAIRDRLARAG